ncbi:Hypothetical predicted protein, partial [Paramuricea clavata]
MCKDCTPVIEKTSWENKFQLFLSELKEAIDIYFAEKTVTTIRMKAVRISGAYHYRNDTCSGPLKPCTRQIDQYRTQIYANLIISEYISEKSHIVKHIGFRISRIIFRLLRDILLERTFFRSDTLHNYIDYIGRKKQVNIKTTTGGCLYSSCRICSLCNVTLFLHLHHGKCKLSNVVSCDKVALLKSIRWSAKTAAGVPQGRSYELIDL